MKQYVILVDEKDNQVGVEEKLKAHSNGGKLHRAISVFVFNDKGELMLQRRAGTKYHATGLWANTCCSHPMPGEDVDVAARRRLNEEMGIDCKVKKMFEFLYHADVGKGLMENEYDHVFFARYNDKPKINPEEVENWRWISLTQLRSEISKNPKRFAPWLILMMDKVSETYKSKGKRF